MARIDTQQTNFTAGELSRRMLGRTDIARYQNGAKTMRNCHPVVQGGAMRRDGLRYIRPAKPAAARAMLVRFVFAADQAYVLEFGHFYMRVFRNRANVESSPGVPYEIVTPYDVADLPRLTFAQRADTMYIASGIYPVQRLRRFDHDDWVIEAAPFDPIPFAEVGTRPAADLTLSAATVGAGRTITASAAVFLASDVGRSIWAGTGIAKITAYTDTTHVTCEITTAFAGTAVASGTWQLRDSPRTDCTPSAFEPLGAAITLTLAAAGWRAEDVGKHVAINGGLCKITAFTSTTVVDATIQSVLLADTAAPSEAWELQSSVWNANDEYPQAVAMHQQALYLGGTVTNPQTIWRSRIGELLSFEMGVNDDSAFAFTLDSNEENNIVHLFPIKQLMALTLGGAFSIYGGVEKAIGPTNIQAENESDNGSARVRPVRVGKELLFVHRDGKTVHSFSYTYTSDEFDDDDLSLLSSHLTEVGIVDMAYQQKPESIVWIVCADGTLASITMNRKQEVIGWAQHTTDGHFESVATVPASGRDDVYFVVRRVIGGSTLRYVEHFDPDLNTDCAITGTSAGSDTWSGLDHLEGEEVCIKADGVNMARDTVVDGEITLVRDALAVEIGLPYRHTIETLNPEVPGAGTIQKAAKSISSVTARVLDTVGFDLNGVYVDDRHFGSDLLDQPPPTFTGDIDVTNFGWGTDVSNTIESDLPFDFHLLSLIYTLTANS